jgi:hypothetical protein
MPINLTGNKIKDTYSQLLHIDGGPAGAEKVVHSGTGVATALSLGTGSASVDNLRLDGNTISSTDTNGNINITPNGTGAVVIPTGTFTDLIATSFTTAPAAAKIAVSGTSVVASGTDTNIDINLTPKGTGEVNVTNIDILSGKVPFSTITSRALAAFSDITDQVGSTSTPAAVKFGTVELAGSGITMVTDGTNLTRLTFAAAGTYSIVPNLQIANSDSSDHALSVWFALNGVNIPRSNTRVSVPKLSEGGVTFFQIVFYVTVTAGQYVQLFWLPSNTAITLDHIPAVVGPPAVPAAPSAIISAERIA